MELTARRALSFLSGGELVPLLGDILYPSEKELLAERFGNSDGNVAFFLLSLSDTEGLWIELGRW